MSQRRSSMDTFQAMLSRERTLRQIPELLFAGEPKKLHSFGMRKEICGNSLLCVRTRGASCSGMRSRGVLIVHATDLDLMRREKFSTVQLLRAFRFLFPKYLDR